MKSIIGWVRDAKGKITDRPLKRICNAITTMAGGGHIEEDGMGNTTPYVMEIYEDGIIDR